MTDREKKYRKGYTAKPRRYAVCLRCGRTVPSDPRLRLFKQHSARAYDSFYCGCGIKL